MITLTNQGRIAKISNAQGAFMVYVGFQGDANCPGEETIPAHFFNGTCMKSYKTEKGALRAANKFLSE